MSPEQQKVLDEAVIQLINKSTETLSNSIEFLSGELPIYISELLKWNFTYNFIYFLCSVLAIMLYLYFEFYRKNSFYKMCKEEIKNMNGYEFPSITLINMICSVVVLVSSLSNLNIEWLKIWIAPRVWLIEYAAKLVKSNG